MMKDSGSIDKKEKPSRLFITIGAIVMCYILYMAGCTLLNNIRLKFYGKMRKAVVTKVINYEGTNSAVNYEFEVNGIVYYKKKVPISGKKVVGDSIFIIYLPYNPEVSLILDQSSGIDSKQSSITGTD